jgi:hypothetical protein
MTAQQRIEVLNVNHPDSHRQVDAEMYAAMRDACLAVLPPAAPGLTIAESVRQITELLPERLFPGGAKAGWWAKTVQLDLEAKGVIARERSHPIRLHRA